MEPFLRKRLTFLSFFWDKIWPVAAPDDGVPGFPDPAASAEPEPPATEPCSPPVPMQLFQALYDFRARCSAELSVSRGDRLYALKEEGDYIFARRLSGPPSTGLVPITHLAKATPETLSDHPWYFSGISRAGAQQLLLSPANAPGAFLIRPSESSHGDYSLSEGPALPQPGGAPCLLQGQLEADPEPTAAALCAPAYMKLADLSKEIQTLKSLKHERLIRLHAVCSEGQPVYIVTELMRKGNLQAFLGSPEGRALGLPLLLSFACQVAEGMSYLEDRRIVHRDLAARNVLVGDDLACKVADFGLARLLKDDIYSPSSGSKIPVKWTAPEAANYRIYSQKSDVWSFGVLLYEVFTYGQCPYEGLSNHETLQQVTRGYRLPCPASCPAEVYTLMLECWKGSPEERPAFATLQKKLSAAHRRLTPAHT
ncbi:tyrosine-protein kinase Srms isoform X3 [Zalophus californianus]|uniref:non-specific protein-tyrosine kinase n=1 Tax=Zalophus californianus TaxID=9704 RepID=A0A6J2FA65_ZALCA|nr:tyrosine-protein kinase Srms isoform X3 [Zalophus californianus]